MMCENLCKQSGFVSLLREAMAKLQDRIERKGGGLTVPLPRAGTTYTLYGLDHCPYSARALAALQAHGISNFDSWTLSDLGTTRQALWAELDAKTDFKWSRHSTFPICFKGDHFLGGSDVLLADLTGI